MINLVSFLINPTKVLNVMYLCLIAGFLSTLYNQSPIIIIMVMIFALSWLFSVLRDFHNRKDP